MGYYRKEEKGMKKFVALLLVLVMAFPMQGYASEPKWGEVFEKDGFSYRINQDGNSVTISRYNGNGGDVVIPSEIDGKKVTAIDEAFGYCSSLTSVEIPDSVTAIFENSFAHCSSLTSVSIPNSVKTIEVNAFLDCSSLSNIIIPDSVTYIGAGAFWGCKNLKEATIPASVISTVDAPAGSIQRNIFQYCSSLESISVAETNPVFDSRDNCNAAIQKKDDGNILVMGCKNTKIPDSVTQIGEQAFVGCSDLSNITIPNGVTNIAAWAFGDCSSLTSVTIPDSVTSIGSSAFLGCSSLTSVTIPDSVTSIGSYTF